MEDYDHYANGFGFGFEEHCVQQFMKSYYNPNPKPFLHKFTKKDDSEKELEVFEQMLKDDLNKTKIKIKSKFSKKEDSEKTDEILKLKKEKLEEKYFLDKLLLYPTAIEYIIYECDNITDRDKLFRFINKAFQLHPFNPERYNYWNCIRYLLTKKDKSSNIYKLCNNIVQEQDKVSQIEEDKRLEKEKQRLIEKERFIEVCRQRKKNFILKYGMNEIDENCIGYDGLNKYVQNPEFVIKLNTDFIAQYGLHGYNKDGRNWCGNTKEQVAEIMR